MKILKSGSVYFALVFGAGFLLGSIRVPWLVPRVGMRIAELIEMPIMFVVVLLAARWVVRRYAVPPTATLRFALGVWALGLLLFAEGFLVLGLQGLKISQYLASHDPVSGVAYIAMLGVFAAMPLLVGRRRTHPIATSWRNQPDPS